MRVTSRRYPATWPPWSARESLITQSMLAQLFFLLKVGHDKKQITFVSNEIISGETNPCARKGTEHPFTKTDYNDVISLSR